MEAVVLLGAPGAGKGTAAEAISVHSNYRHVSTGNILREAVKAGTEVGRQAKTYMDQGQLVPDAIIIKLVTDLMCAGGANARYLFDGFPRTLAQAALLDEEMKKLGGRISLVFLMESPRQVLVDRIAGRRICRSCGAVYHVKNIPPRVDGVCDQCGGPLYQRADDCEATVEQRLEVYEKQTASLIDYYKNKGLLVPVDAGGRANDTEARMLAVLKEGSPRP